MKQVGEVCWLGGLPVRKGLGDWRVVGLWGSQQSFIRGGGGGGRGPPYGRSNLLPFYIPFLTEKQGSTKT